MTIEEQRRVGRSQGILHDENADVTRIEVNVAVVVKTARGGVGR
jgi:hypothetical protein